MDGRLRENTGAFRSSFAGGLRDRRAQQMIIQTMPVISFPQPANETCQLFFRGKPKKVGPHHCCTIITIPPCSLDEKHVAAATTRATRNVPAVLRGLRLGLESLAAILA